MSVSTRYHTLDHWRGIACVLVIAHHATYYVATEQLDARVRTMSGLTVWDVLCWSTALMWVGVPLFFVISGYCIAASAMSLVEKGGSSEEFFLKRLRRIYPPLYVYLAVAVTFVLIVEHFRPGLLCDDIHPIHHPLSLSWQSVLGNLTLTEEWREILFGPPKRWVTGHMWTLCFEEQFYIIVGVTLIVARKHVMLASALLTAFVAVLYVVEVPAPKGTFLAGYWLQFAAGIGVYYAVNRASTLGRWAVIGALLLGFAETLRSDGWTSFEPAAAQRYGTVYLFALALIFLHRFDGYFANRFRRVSLCGVMCYSLYLVHWPITKFISHSAFLAGYDSPRETVLFVIPACAVASVAVAWPFHVFVERRFMSTTQKQAEREAIATVAA